MSNKKIMITGASSGIGKAILRRLFLMFPDAQFFTVNRRNIPVEDRPLDLNIHQFPADLSLWNELNELCCYISKWKKLSIDILVNNAGVMPFHKFGVVGVDEYNAVMDLNLRAPFFLSQAVIEHMPKGGRIINIASISGSRAEADIDIVEYCASKAGLIMLTKTLAKLYPDLCVNSVSPGFTHPTNLVDINQPTPEVLVQQIPKKRVARPDEIAEMVGYLCSPYGEYITGQDLIIDGGKSL